MTLADAKKGTGAGEWLLLAVAIAWGLTFFSTKSLIERMPVMDFLTVRFAFATLLLIAIAPKALRMSRATLLHGLLIGVAFALAQITQTFGLANVSASVSGFITGLYVVFTPLLGAVLFKVRVRPMVWAAVGLAVVGLAILSMRLGSGDPFGVGEWLTLIGAVAWGLHITLVGRYSQPDNVISLTIVSTGVAALIFAVGGVRDGITLPNNTADWMWLIYFATIVGAGTELAQVWAQARVEASKAAVLMVTEPLWAALFAVLFGGESVTWRLLAGGGLMVVAMLVAVRAHPPEPDPDPG